MKNTNKIKRNGGAAMMILVFFFVFISLTILIGIVVPVLREYRIASDNFKSKQSYFLAESGIEDILFRMKNNISFDTNETLTLGESFTTTAITDISNNQKEIISLGDADSHQRKLNLTVDTGIGVSFSYGVLSGQGGFEMENNSQVIGSVYSNGSITGSGIITGAAMSANSASLVSDQSNGSGFPDYDVTFGDKNISQDFAQSFQVSQTEVVNKVSLYLKKVGLPPNLTVRIVNNAGGNPGTTTITTGSLSASLVSTNYGWVDVPFSSNPQLIVGTTYWLVIDGGTSSSKYYKIGGNSNGYANGTAKIGQYLSSWNLTNPVDLDGFFNLYTGGAMGLIEGITIGQNGKGSAYAHTVNNSTIADTNYCQTGTGNNKSCDTSRADPVQMAMPISTQNILDWKEFAEIGGVHTGDYIVSSDMELGPKKITGNLTINGGIKLTLGGALWVEGNLVMENNSIMDLASWYESSEGIIVVDGTITIGNNATFANSGTEGSYVLALTTSNSDLAITLANNAGAVVLYAVNGTINISNNGTAKSLTGNFIHLNNNAIIVYDSGLANANFVSGPSGSWNVSDWREVE